MLRYIPLILPEPFLFVHQIASLPHQMHSWQFVPHLETPVELAEKVECVHMGWLVCSNAVRLVFSKQL